MRTQPPELPTVRMKVKDLSPDEKNPRKITPAKLAKLRDRILRFGHAGVFVWNKRLGKMVGGHQRAKALEMLGVDQVDVKVGEWDEAEHAALEVALNTHDGTWDHDLLSDRIASIKDADQSLLAFTGLADEKITLLLEGVGRTLKAAASGDLVDPDRIEKPKKPTTKRGDVWSLGDHRVMCGDATDAKDMARLMGKAKAALIHTDPPYGVDYKDGAVKNDDLVGDALLALVRDSLRLMGKHSGPDAPFYVWHADSNADDFRDALKAAGLAKKQTILWVKPSPAPTRSDYQYQHEPCFYACKDGASPPFYGDRANMTVWMLAARGDDNAMALVLGKGIHVTDGSGNSLWIEQNPPVGKKVRRQRLTGDRPVFIEDSKNGTVWFLQRDRNTVHPTQKPVAIPAKAILNSSKEGDIVLDPFAGSGSTLMAAEQLQRRAYLMELDAGYVDVIVRTWEKMTGKKATREKA